MSVQAACHQEVFECLRQHFDCRFECFASPLNCRYPRFCSLFLDADAPFGSLGSFADLHPAAGSFQANPPFDRQSVKTMADHIFALLGKAQARTTSLPLCVRNTGIMCRRLSASAERMCESCLGVLCARQLIVTLSGTTALCSSRVTWRAVHMWSQHRICMSGRRCLSTRHCCRC